MRPLSSLSYRIALASALLAGLVILVMGSFSYSSMAERLQEENRRTLSRAAQLTVVGVEAKLRALVAQLREMAANTLVSNALVDSLGREVYLVPFLNGVRSVADVPVWVGIADFSGRIIAQNDNGGTLSADAAWLAARVEAGTPASRVVRDGERLWLVLAYPIVYPNTGQAEGVLVGQFAAEGLLDARAPQDIPLRRSLLFRQPGQVWRAEALHAPPVPQDPLILRLDISAQEMLATLSPQVEVVADARALASPLRRLLRESLLLGLVVMAGASLLGWLAARRLTLRLRTLEEASQAVVTGGVYSHRFALPGQDEVARLGQTFDRMLEHLEEAWRQVARQAEEALRRSETRYQAMVERQKDLICRFRADGQLTFVNPAFAAFLGQAPWQGQSFPQLFPVSGREEIAAWLVRIGDGGESPMVENSLPGPDGETRWIQWMIQPLADDEGRVEEVQAVGRDFTVRRRMEQRNAHMLHTQILVSQLLRIALSPLSLAESMEKVFDLLLSLPWLPLAQKGVLFLVDDQGDLVPVVRRGLDEVFLSVCGRVPVGECFCGQAAATRRVVSGDVSREEHTRQVPGLSHLFHFCVPVVAGERVLGVLTLYLESGKRLDDEEERLLHAVADALAGVIERHRLDEELIRSRREAQSANQAKSRFLAVMSHDIRTPIGVILGMGELLGETELDEEQSHFLQAIHRSGEALLSLVNDILDLSRIESGQFSLARAPFPLAVLVRGAADLLRLKAQGKGVDVVCAFDPALPARVVGDPDRLRQVLLNLLGNAVKFTERGRVTLEVAREQAGRYAFTVTDTGPGIPPEEREAVFAPYVQAKTAATRRAGGTGLGLAICKELVERMGGTIRALEGPDGGARFHFHVLLEEEEGACGAEEAVAPEALFAGAGPYRILVVDDLEDNRRLLMEYLGQGPFLVEVAHNGGEGLEKLRGGGYHLALMDMEMPVMDGFEATRLFRLWEKERGRPRLPVVAVTAYATREDETRCLEAGCDVFLAKPVARARLLRVMGDLLRVR